MDFHQSLIYKHSGISQKKRIFTFYKETSIFYPSCRKILKCSANKIMLPKVLSPKGNDKNRNLQSFYLFRLLIHFHPPSVNLCTFRKVPGHDNKRPTSPPLPDHFPSYTSCIRWKDLRLVTFCYVMSFIFLAYKYRLQPIEQSICKFQQIITVLSSTNLSFDRVEAES